MNPATDRRCFADINLGRTKVEGGAPTADGGLLAEESIPTKLEDGDEVLSDRAAELAGRIGGQDALEVSVAGLIDRGAGVLIESPNMHGLDGDDLGIGRSNCSARSSAPTRTGAGRPN